MQASGEQHSGPEHEDLMLFWPAVGTTLAPSAVRRLIEVGWELITENGVVSLTQVHPARVGRPCGYSHRER